MILLINPPFNRFMNLEQAYIPLSLLAVGSHMAANGEEVLIKNMEIGDDSQYMGYFERADYYDVYIKALNNPEHPVWLELHQLIKDIKPDKIGINVLNVKYQSSLRIIDIANQYNIPVVVGGNHPTTSPDAYPENVEVFQGEFESNGGRLKSLDDAPFPNFDILADKYSPNGYGHILSARGCPFLCTFCASKIMWNRKVVFKSIDILISEMKYVNERFDTDYFTFWVSTTIQDQCNV
jgi:anaerobic magnesium-protoporphyrin IX monomethyl ester cyclase